jgi:hypothetical protein
LAQNALLLVFVLALALAPGASLMGAQPSQASQQRLVELLQQRRNSVPPDAARTALRAQLLAAGEAALERGQSAAAQQAFERAALISHAADTEMGIVRAFMQGGYYRRALAFGAHAALAHLDEAGGAALYAWLLHAGGQSAPAARLLAEALARHPNHPGILAAQAQLASATPVATEALLRQPLMLAPGASGARVSASADSVATALLFDRGRLALAPSAALAGARRVWVRNGLGVTTPAARQNDLAALGLTVLKLSAPLAMPEQLSVAGRDAFAGSQGRLVFYAPGSGGRDGTTSSGPRWPLLVSGFIGNAVDAPVSARSSGSSGSSAVARRHHLGVSNLPAVRGAPVFDAAGRLVGIANSSRNGNLLIPLDALQRALGPRASRLGTLSIPGAVTPGMEQPLDVSYEQFMHQALQVLVSKK